MVNTWCQAAQRDQIQSNKVSIPAYMDKVRPMTSKGPHKVTPAGSRIYKEIMPVRPQVFPRSFHQQGLLPSGVLIPEYNPLYTPQAGRQSPILSSTHPDTKLSQHAASDHIIEKSLSRILGSRDDLHPGPAGMI